MAFKLEKATKIAYDAILKSSLCASAISNSPKKLKCLNDLSEKPVNGQCKHKRLVEQESCSDRARRPEASGNSVQSSPQLLPSSTDNKKEEAAMSVRQHLNQLFMSLLL